MKLLHTSDWHLGMGFRGAVSYEEDQRFVIGEICKIAVAEQVDGILLAGDVFDKSVASPEAIRLYDEVMTHICMDLKLPVYMVAGNHDGADRLSQLAGLLKNSGLFIAGHLTKDAQVVNVGEVDIYLLPWISTDKVRYVYPEQREDVVNLEAAYRIVLDHYRERFVPGHKNLLVAHAFITNAETSTSDRAAEVGQAAMVSASVFDGFDYVALGHIHGPQSIRKNIRYCGTPMAYSFGKEEKQEKSVTILDTETMELSIVPLTSLRKRTTLRGTYDELLKADVEEAVRCGFVRLEVTDSYVGMETYAMLRERYPLLLEVVGQDPEQQTGRITMTVDEFRRPDQDPMEVFCVFCKDEMGVEPKERQLRLFKEAVATYDKEVSGL